MSKLAEYRAILENQNRIYGVYVIRSDVNVLGRDIPHNRRNCRVESQHES